MTFLSDAAVAANTYNALKLAWDRTELMDQDKAMKAAVKIARMHLVNTCKKLVKFEQRAD